MSHQVFPGQLLSSAPCALLHLLRSVQHLLLSHDLDVTFWIEIPLEEPLLLIVSARALSMTSRVHPASSVALVRQRERPFLLIEKQRSHSCAGEAVFGSPPATMHWMRTQSLVIEQGRGTGRVGKLRRTGEYCSHSLMALLRPFGRYGNH